MPFACTIILLIALASLVGFIAIILAPSDDIW